jgi:oligoendopeptidase F
MITNLDTPDGINELDILISSSYETMDRLEHANSYNLTVKLIDEVQETKSLHSELRSISILLVSQDKSNNNHQQFRMNVLSMSSKFHKMMNRFDEFVSKLPLELMNEIKGSHPHILHYLLNRKNHLTSKLSYDIEQQIENVSTNSYKAWEAIFNNAYHSPKNEQTIHGLYSALTKFNNEEEKQERRNSLDQILKDRAPQLSITLNSITGYRADLYKARRWVDHKTEALFHNQITAKSIENMWEQVSRRKNLTKLFFNTKRSILQNEDLNWFNITNTVTPVFKKENISLNEAKEILIKAFNEFDSALGHFTELAFNRGWIDAEYSELKMDDAYCVYLPVTEEPRVYMNFKNSIEDVITLAHELGHAYHYYQMRELPIFAQMTAVSFDEAIALFTENLLMTYLIKNSKEQSSKQYILERKLQYAAIFFIDIYVRYLFEEDLYLKRIKEYLSIDEINKIMLKAQKTVLPNIHEYFPEYWMVKPHFFNTSMPYYNFPYTLGYLISIGLFNKFQIKKENNIKDFNAFLFNSGMKDLNELMLDFFKLDLECSNCWDEAFDTIHKELNELSNSLEMLRCEKHGEK